MRVKAKLDIKKYVSWIILIVLVVFFSVFSPRFLQLSNAITVLRQVSINGILAVGLAYVLIAGGIDLSLGPMLGLSGTLAAMLMVENNVPIFWACLAAVAVTTIFGLLNGLAVTMTNMPALISTLGMSYVIKAVAYLIHGGMPVYSLPKAVQIIGQGYAGPIPVPVIIFVIIAMMGAFVLKRTSYGREVFAIGSNPECSRLSGLNVKLIQVAVYTIAGFLAGLGGIIMMSRLNAGQPGTGADTSMDIIIGCVLGGVSASGGEGSIAGMVGGVLVMGVLSNGMTILGLNEYYQLLMKGLVLVIAVGIDYYTRTRKALRKSHIIRTEKKQ